MEDLLGLEKGTITLYSSSASRRSKHSWPGLRQLCPLMWRPLPKCHQILSQGPTNHMRPQLAISICQAKYPLRELHRMAHQDRADWQPMMQVSSKRHPILVKRFHFSPLSLSLLPDSSQMQPRVECNQDCSLRAPYILIFLVSYILIFLVYIVVSLSWTF